MGAVTNELLSPCIIEGSVLGWFDINWFFSNLCSHKILSITTKHPVYWSRSCWLVKEETCTTTFVIIKYIFRKVMYITWFFLFVSKGDRLIYIEKFILKWNRNFKLSVWIYKATKRTQKIKCSTPENLRITKMTLTEPSDRVRCIFL